MGSPNSSHIREFVKGKIVRDIVQRKSGEIFISFEDGESLRLEAHFHRKYDFLDLHRAKRIVINSISEDGVCTVEVIATPFQANGQVKQSALAAGTRNLTTPCHEGSMSWRENRTEYVLVVSLLVLVVSLFVFVVPAN